MGYITKITDTGSTTHPVAHNLYGTCSTAAGTAAKVVTCTDWDTKAANIPVGTTIHVKFTNANTVASPTLNINSTGAINIYRYGTTATGTTAAIWWEAGSVVSFTYDGSAWIINSYKSGDVNHNTDRYVNSATFADDTANNTTSPVKMTLTRAGSDTATVTANIPKISSSSAGVAPKGAAVSSQDQTTKFLREDGSWAAPSYTTNTNNAVTQTITSSTNADYRVLLSGTADDTTRTEGVRKDTDFKYNPSTNNLTVGKVTLAADPSNNLEAATKKYVDDNATKVKYQTTESEIWRNVLLSTDTASDSTRDKGAVGVNYFIRFWNGITSGGNDGAILSIGENSGAGVPTQGYLRFYSDQGAYADLTISRNAVFQSGLNYFLPQEGGTILTNQTGMSIDTNVKQVTYKAAEDATWRNIIMSTDTQSETERDKYVAVHSNITGQISNTKVSGEVYTNNYIRIGAEGTSSKRHRGILQLYNGAGYHADIYFPTSATSDVNVAFPAGGGTLVSTTGCATGVKGSAEGSYRTGNVSISAANVGAVALSGGTMTGSLTTVGLTNDGTFNNKYSVYLNNDATDTGTKRGVYYRLPSDNYRSLIQANGSVTDVGDSNNTTTIYGSTITLGNSSTTSVSSAKAFSASGNITSTGNIVANNNNTTMGSSNYGYRVYDGTTVMNLAMFKRPTSGNALFTFANVPPGTNATWSSPVNAVYLGNEKTNEIRMVNINSSMYGTISSGSQLYVDSNGKIGKSSSTKRSKTNIEYLNLEDKKQYHDKLMQLKPVIYEFKNNLGTTELGLIAEDVYDTCPIAALKEVEPVYNMTEEEAKEKGIEREVAEFKENGEIENYKDRAILAMLIADCQYKDKQIEELKQQISNLISQVNNSQG